MVIWIYASIQFIFASLLIKPIFYFKKIRRIETIHNRDEASTGISLVFFVPFVVEILNHKRNKGHKAFE
tara:strand:- start:4381 stop:4587 length:207 start_codon:yes stop_codon:yes gene_type:complete